MLVFLASIFVSCGRLPYFHPTMISRVFSFISQPCSFFSPARGVCEIDAFAGGWGRVCVCIWLRRYKVKEPNAARWIHPVVQASVLLPLVRICLIQYASNSVKIASERRAPLLCARVYLWTRWLWKTAARLPACLLSNFCSVNRKRIIKICF